MKILSCPFCGNNPNLLYGINDCDHFVICNCEVGMSINKWNTRHSYWISIKDKKPEAYKNIIFTDGKEVYFGQLWEEYFLVSDINNPYCDSFPIEKISHWQSLPKLPKEII